jgi:hypothetical protein
MSHQIVRATAQILSATRLLAAEEAADLKVLGMPKKFWLVTTPTADQELEDCCIEVSFAQFMDKVKNGLEQSDIVGLFKRKGEAESKAKKLLREVKSDAKEAAAEAEKEAKEASDAADFAEQEAGQAEEAEEAAEEAAGEEPGDEVEVAEESVVESAAKAVLSLRAVVQRLTAANRWVRTTNDNP